jgi:3-dehydrosphinganine reductase
MELHSRKIKVSVAFPPDTDTPLLAEENKSKPVITKMLSDASATVAPEVVAASVLSGIEHHSPLIVVGFDGWMLATLTGGMTPQPSPLMLLLEVLSAGLWKVVGLSYVAYFYSVIGKHDTDAAKPKKRA